MTIEEKAKAYDEALERAKQKHGKFSEFVTKTIEEIFPQLRESEDERMRKLIIDRVSSATEMTEGLRELLLTYLEKQKEQKPNYCHHKVDETGWTEEYRKAYYDGWNNCNMQHEQLKADHKPAEWSEEDERMRNGLISLIEEIKLRPLKRMEDWDGYTHFLKSLRPQPKQEWSKEDENKIERLAFLVSVAAEKEMISEEECIDLRNFVKSYCLRPSWKPSEEQMALLRAVISDPNNAGAESCQLVLREIYQQFKKL